MTVRRVCVMLVLMVGVMMVWGQGSIEPPSDAVDGFGNPRATMKTLNQVEPRVAIYTLPWSITNAGSYYLIDRLQDTNNGNGITIDSDDVQLDLNGFSIFGGPGSGHAIVVGSTIEVHNVSIQNGAIVEWDGDGIRATNAFNSEASKLKIEMNKGNGLTIGHSAMVSECIIRACDGTGLIVGDGCNIKNCQSMESQGDGIRTGQGSQIQGCVAVFNGRNGMSLANFGKVQGCLVGMNGSNGIVVQTSCLVQNTGSGLNGTNGVGAGVLVQGRGCRIEGNNINANVSGITLQGSGNRVQDNNLIDNGVGIEDATNGNFIVRNTVGGSSVTNYLMSPQSHYGLIVTNPGAGFTNTNPWANFGY